MKAMPFRYAAALVAAVGLNPYFAGAEFKDSILSEAPFLLWLYASFFLMRNMFREDGTGRLGLLYAVGAGIAAYLSFGTRGVGVVLAPTLILYDLLRHRRPTRNALLAALVFVVLAWLQARSIPGRNGYFALFEATPDSLWNFFPLLFSYIKKLSYLWENHHIRFFSQFLFFTFSAFAIKGYWTRVKDRVTVPEIFLPAYLLVLAAYSTLTPTPPIARHIVPIVPLYVFYGFKGMSSWELLKRKGMEKPVLAAYVAAIALTYAGAYSKMDFGPIAEGVEKKESVELFSHIRENTSDDDVIIFRKPRVMALYAGRQSSLYHTPDNKDELLAYFREIGASYLVVSRVLDGDYLRGFVEEHRSELEEVYATPDFEVYRFGDALGGSSESTAGPASPPLI